MTRNDPPEGEQVGEVFYSRSAMIMGLPFKRDAATSSSFAREGIGNPPRSDCLDVRAAHPPV